MYRDQTGSFIYLSSKFNRYVMVGIHVDCNYVFQEPIKKKTAAQNIDKYQIIFSQMQACGLSIKKHILCNEISADYKSAIRANKVTY